MVLPRKYDKKRFRAPAQTLDSIPCFYAHDALVAPSLMECMLAPDPGSLSSVQPQKGLCHQKKESKAANGTKESQELTEQPKEPTDSELPKLPKLTDCILRDPPEVRFSGPLWVETHRPRHRTLLLGNQKTIQSLSNFIRNQTTKSPVAFLVGPPGVGKTSCAHLLLKQHGYQVTELNASDTRSANQVYSAIIEVVTRKKRALILDELDGATASFSFASSETVESGVFGLARFLKQFQNGDFQGQTLGPVIAILNDTSNKSLRETMKQGTVFRFWPLYDSDLHKIAERLARTHHFHLDPKRISDLIQSCRGDARALIIRLQYLYQYRLPVPGSVTSSDPFVDVFEMTRRLLQVKPANLESVLCMVQGHDFSLALLQVFENAPVGIPEFLDTCSDLDQVPLSLQSEMEPWSWNFLARTCQTFLPNAESPSVCFTPFFDHEKQARHKRQLLLDSGLDARSLIALDRQTVQLSPSFQTRKTALLSLLPSTVPGAFSFSKSFRDPDDPTNCSNGRNLPARGSQPDLSKRKPKKPRPNPSYPTY